MGHNTRNKNLHIRELAHTDLDRTWEWLHRADINEKIGVKIPFSKEEQLRWFEALQKDESKYVFAVCLNKNNNHIGNVSLDMIDKRHKNGRFSIFIAEANVRGLGYGSEALSLLEDFAFKNLKLHKIWCKTDADDNKVLQFYLKSNYKQEGILKEHEWKKEKFIDKLLFAKICRHDN